MRARRKEELAERNAKLTQFPSVHSLTPPLPFSSSPFLPPPALRLAAAKLPVRSEIITTSSPPRLGSLLLDAIPPASAVGASGTGPDAQRIAEEMPELVSQTSKNVVN